MELTPSIEPEPAAARANELEVARGSVELLPAPIELLLPGGLTVRVRENFDAATLRQIGVRSAIHT